MHKRFHSPLQITILITSTLIRLNQSSKLYQGDLSDIAVEIPSTSSQISIFNSLIQKVNPKTQNLSFFINMSLFFDPKSLFEVQNPLICSKPLYIDIRNQSNLSETVSKINQILMFVPAKNIMVLANNLQIVNFDFGNSFLFGYGNARWGEEEIGAVMLFD